MNDMTATIVAKSDQINAADLVGISRTITIKEVRIKAGEDQPVTIMIEGDKKAFRPCKGVRRLLVRVWGPDANNYIGQSLTIFCDPTVTWAGKPEGGIRVSHMTGLDEEIVEYMRTSREKTKPYKILPLVVPPAASTADPAEKWVNAYIAKLQGFTTLDEIAALENAQAARLTDLKGKRPELHERIAAAAEAKRGQLSPSDDLSAGFEEPGTSDRPTEPDPQTNDAASEPSEADKSVDQTIAAAKAATDSAALEAIIAESEKHKIALTDDQVMRLEIAFSQERARLTPAESLV